MRVARVGDRPGHAPQRERRQRQHQVAQVPAAAVEAQDEGDQVDRQRHDPQQRHRGDVLGDVAGDRQQQDAAHRGKARPEQLAPDPRRRFGGTGGSRSKNGVRPGFCFACVGRRDLRHRCRSRAGLHQGGGDAQCDEQPVARRPGDRLRVRGDPRLDRERIGEQRQHRCQIRKREQPVRIASRVALREPGLQQRAGRRQQQVGQADRRRQQPEDQPQRALGAQRLPGDGGDDGQQQEACDQQRRVQRSLPPARQAPGRRIGVGIAREQRALEEHQAGRPHRGRAPEPRQDLLGDDRLDQEQQERTREDRQRVEDHSVRDRRWRRRPLYSNRRAIVSL